VAAKRPLNVGLVGCGFMGRTHSNAWGKVNQFFELEYQPVLKAVCARNPEEVQGFAEQWGYESTETDWRALVARDDIDLIDIASPNDTHAEIAIAAAATGKMVTTEKPLARGGAESEHMVEAVDAAGVPNMVWYNYRRVPAVTLAKQLIDEGGWVQSSTTAPSSCRTGRSPETSPREARRSGGSTSTWPAAASPAICWRIASTPRSGSMATSTAFRP
jgi:predicted dehydrogenase